MLRRDLLKFAALGLGGASAGLVPVGRGAFAALNPTPGPTPRRLVVIFMRGAVDGLNVVVPYTDSGYYAARPTIALNRPGADGGVLDLDGRFGLHPALAPLMPLWQAGKLTFVPASGSPDPTRSHFDAQDYMESATPGRKATADGWMNRLLGVLPTDGGQRDAPTRGVSVGPVLPRIFSGHNAVANIAAGEGATKPTLLDRPQVGAAFNQLYDGDDKLSQAFQESQRAHKEVMQSMAPETVSQEMQRANNGAPLPNGFPNDAARLAMLMRNDARVELAFMAVGGWDTHANQGAATGQLANRLSPLGQGLAALASGLGSTFDDTVIVVMSEFGRTVHQNGNGGTDHGHGNVMWVMGGSVAGGRIQGRWPGLDNQALYEGRDVAVTTDFREVLAQVSERHLRLPDAKLAELFPGYAAQPGSAVKVMRA